jgi:hypothetical protein
MRERTFFFVEKRKKGQRRGVSLPQAKSHPQPVAIRPSPDTDGLFDIYFAHHQLMRIDLRQNPSPAP